MIGYKLFTLRKDGTLGSLFINRSKRIVPGVEYKAGKHKTRGFAYRPGWHICPTRNAPHLTTKGRVWCKVRFSDYEALARPESQGGTWYLAGKMKVIEVYNETGSGSKN